MTICDVFTGVNAQMSKLLIFVGDDKLFLFVAVHVILKFTCLSPDYDEDYSNDNGGKQQCFQDNSTAHNNQLH